MCALGLPGRDPRRLHAMGRRGRREPAVGRVRRRLGRRSRRHGDERGDRRATARGRPTWAGCRARPGGAHVPLRGGWRCAGRDAQRHSRRGEEPQSARDLYPQRLSRARRGPRSGVGAGTDGHRPGLGLGAYPDVARDRGGEGATPLHEPRPYSRFGLRIRRSRSPRARWLRVPRARRHGSARLATLDLRAFVQSVGRHVRTQRDPRRRHHWLRRARSGGSRDRARADAPPRGGDRAGEVVRFSEP